MKNFDVVGMDIGNITTIACCRDNSIVVESRIEKADELKKLGGTENILVVGGKEYLVGKGFFEQERFKFQKENFLKLLYFAIAKVTDLNNIKLVIGIPAGQYSSKKDELINLIRVNGLQTIEIYENGEKIKKEIAIQEVMVVPEGYGIKTMNIIDQLEKGKDTLVIDIGGITTDIAEFNFEMSFQGGESLNKGLSNLFLTGRNSIENALNSPIKIEDVRSYFDGERTIEKSVLEEATQEFYKNWINELKSYYQLNQYNTVLVGGGASKLYSLFKNDYPSALKIDDIKVNAIGNLAIGEKQWDM